MNFVQPFANCTVQTVCLFLKMIQTNCKLGIYIAAIYSLS